MGFNADKSRNALIISNNNLNIASELLINNDAELDLPLPPEFT